MIIWYDIVKCCTNLNFIYRYIWRAGNQFCIHYKPMHVNPSNKYSWFSWLSVCSANLKHERRLSNLAFDSSRDWLNPWVLHQDWWWSFICIIFNALSVSKTTAISLMQPSSILQSNNEAQQASESRSSKHHISPLVSVTVLYNCPVVRQTDVIMLDRFEDHVERWSVVLACLKRSISSHEQILLFI